MPEIVRTNKINQQICEKMIEDQGLLSQFKGDTFYEAHLAHSKTRQKPQIEA